MPVARELNEKEIRAAYRMASINAAACIFFLALGLDNSINHFEHHLAGTLGMYLVAALQAAVCVQSFARAISAQIKGLRPPTDKV